MTGKAIGFVEGGQLHTVHRSIAVSCKPDDIPVKIDVDITNLKLGDVLHVSDLKMPAGTKAALPPTEAVASIVAPQKEKTAAEEAAEALLPRARFLPLPPVRRLPPPLVARPRLPQGRCQGRRQARQGGEEVTCRVVGRWSREPRFEVRRESSQHRFHGGGRAVAAGQGRGMEEQVRWRRHPLRDRRPAHGIAEAHGVHERLRSSSAARVRLLPGGAA
jgi:hypothetical protein